MRLGGRPTAVHAEIGPGDLRGVITAQEQRERSNLLGGDEFLGGLSRQQDVVDDLISRQATCLIVFGICFSTSGVQT